MPDKFLIVGLGNPGKKYVNTRHNAGFLAINRFAKEVNATFKKLGNHSRIAHTSVEHIPVILLKPQLYMNNSGISVANVINYYKIDLSRVLIILDDFNLPLGKIRLRPQGSAGGHNGLKSIIEHLKTQNFARLRLGIGNEDNRLGMTDFVLSEFSKAEWPAVEEMIATAVDATKTFITRGLDIAMTRYNN